LWVCRRRREGKGGRISVLSKEMMPYSYVAACEALVKEVLRRLRLSVVVAVAHRRIIARCGKAKGVYTSCIGKACMMMTCGDVDTSLLRGVSTGERWSLWPWLGGRKQGRVLLCACCGGGGGGGRVGCESTGVVYSYARATSPANCLCLAVAGPCPSCEPVNPLRRHSERET
jgi:hypothetical protein